MGDAWVVDAVRTPIGRYAGALSGVRPDDLAATVIRELVVRHTAVGFDPKGIDDVLIGDANGAGEDSRNVARMATLLAGLPTSVPGATVNRLCGSGMEAVIQGSRAIEAGDADVIVAGGVESMSRAPWVLARPVQAFPHGPETLHSTALGWRMTNPAMPDHWTVTLGEGAEILADQFSISRDEQDAFAVESHQRAAAAWDQGRYDAEVVLVDGTDLTRDECIRADCSMEGLARLTPAFRPGGTVTAGNASPMNDGAAALLMASDIGLVALGGPSPLARVAARAASGVDPQVYGLGPVAAANKALSRAGIRWSDLDVVELNEAFASQSLACLRSWPDLDPSIVNANGGAIALGHPLGCSGARIIVSLAHELRRRGGGWGLAAICIGVGQGLAVVLKG